MPLIQKYIKKETFAQDHKGSQIWLISVVVGNDVFMRLQNSTYFFFYRRCMFSRHLLDWTLFLILLERIQERSLHMVGVIGTQSLCAALRRSCLRELNSTPASYGELSTINRNITGSRLPVELYFGQLIF